LVGVGIVIGVNDEPFPVSSEPIAEPAGLAFHLPFDKFLAAATSDPACAPVAPVAVPYEPGPVGDAVVIASDVGARYPEPASFPLNGQSIALWVRLHGDTTEGGQLPFIFRKDDPERVGRHRINDQEIRFAAQNKPKAPVQLKYTSGPGLTEDGTYSRCGRSYAVWAVRNADRNRWLHVCVTVARFGRSFGTRMYVQGRIAAVGRWQTPPQLHGRTFTLGGSKQTLSLDDFRAYDRVLDAKEVYELYRMGARRAEHLSREAGSN